MNQMRASPVKYSARRPIWEQSVTGTKDGLPEHRDHPASPDGAEIQEYDDEHHQSTFSRRPGRHVARRWCGERAKPDPKCRGVLVYVANAGRAKHRDHGDTHIAAPARAAAVWRVG